MRPQGNDNYGIEEDWATLKMIIDAIGPDMEYFLENRGKNASVRIRNRLNVARKGCISLRKKILEQRQDNDSDYSY